VRFRAAGLHGDNRIAAAAGADGIDVRTTSIDEFCAARGLSPTFIKVDVEGAELDVLKGARRTIAAERRDLHLYVEMHPRLWPLFGASREQIERELSEQGLVAERLDGRPDIWELEGVCLRVRPCAF
jgi:hypothetical protein